MSRAREAAVLSTEKQRLPVKLSNEELLARGQRLAQIEAELLALADAAQAERERIKVRREALEGERANVATDVREGFEFRDVEVRSVADFAEGVCREVRTDTGEVVSERHLTPAERQTRLELGGDAA